MRQPQHYNMKTEIKKEESSILKEKYSQGSPLKGMMSNKFSYSFNPTMNPAFNASTKKNVPLKSMSYNNLPYQNGKPLCYQG